MTRTNVAIVNVGAGSASALPVCSISSLTASDFAANFWYSPGVSGGVMQISILAANGVTSGQSYGISLQCTGVK